MTIVQIKIAVWIGFEAFNNGISFCGIMQPKLKCLYQGKRYLCRSEI